MSVKIAIAAGMLLAAQGLSASAATYTYVGSWTVSPSFEQDPTGALYWQNNPAVFTGQEAAAYLFGGTAADYVISTVSSLVDDINFSAWLDGWGDDVAYATGGTPAAQDFSYDSTGLGYNGCAIAGTECYQSAYSALIYDHLTNQTEYVNYAFRVSDDVDVAPVPLPAGGLMLVTALAGFAALKRRKDA